MRTICCLTSSYSLLDHCFHVVHCTLSHCHELHCLVYFNMLSFSNLNKAESYNWTMPQKYKKSGTLWIYGDSVSMQLYRSAMRGPLCKSLYKNCGSSYMWVYPAKYKGLNITLEEDLDFRPEIVIKTITDVLHTPEMQQEESVLVFNLVVHYAKSVNFTTYQRLIDDLILLLKGTELSHGERVPKYKAKIIWKSSTAPCKDNVSRKQKQTDFRFFTSQVCTLWFVSF